MEHGSRSSGLTERQPNQTMANPNSSWELQQKRDQQEIRGWSGNSSEQDVANSYGEGLEIGQGFREHAQSELSTIERSGCVDRAGWSAEPCGGRVADGVPNRVDRIKGLGNAVVPQLIQAIGELVIEADREMRSGR